MAVQLATIAPFIDDVFTITGTQYHYNSGAAHGGLDIATGSSSLHRLYSMVDGRVVSVVKNHSSYGNYIITQDMTTGDSFLYAHMKSIAVATGDTISKGTFVGIEGSTGNVTGRHVHIELQYLNPGDSWVWGIPYNNRPNVAEYMGLTNTYHLQAIYNGDIPPVPPHPPGPSGNTRKKYPWVIYNRVKMNSIDKKM